MFVINHGFEIKYESIFLSLVKNSKCWKMIRLKKIKN